MSTKRPTVYIESTIPSYLTARKSVDIVTLCHQILTNYWWEKELPNCDGYVSALVLQEIERGDPMAVVERTRAVSKMPILPITQDLIELANYYMGALKLSENARPDALHIALSVLNGIEYLLTWNCRHIANAYVSARLAEVNRDIGRPTPQLCTPEGLIYGDAS